jgi:hypothetical protein
MVFTGTDDRSGELLSLCFRQQWEKARALLGNASLSVNCVHPSPSRRVFARDGSLA